MIWDRSVVASGRESSRKGGGYWLVKLTRDLNTHKVFKEFRCLKDSPGMRIKRQLLSTSLFNFMSP